MYQAKAAQGEFFRPGTEKSKVLDPKALVRYNLNRGSITSE